jgi:hypothetical protein
MKIFAVRRLCVLLLAVFAFASHSSLAQECGEPVVSLGEVMAGFQAGFTGGAHTVTGLPEGYFGAAAFEARRGFVVPETEVPSVQCDNDYILVADWFACGLTNFFGVTIRTAQEAKRCASTAFYGLIPDFHILIDGVRVEHMNTNAKLGTLPDRDPSRVFATMTSGHIIEPFSLAPGLHTATGVFDFDQDCRPLPGNPDGLPPGECDGIPEDPFSLTAEFTIIDSAAEAP